MAADRYCTNAKEGHTNHLDHDYTYEDEKLQCLTDYNEPKAKSNPSDSEAYLHTISERTESESTKRDNVGKTHTIPESEMQGITKAVQKLVSKLPNQIDPHHCSLPCPIQFVEDIEYCKHIITEKVEPTYPSQTKPKPKPVLSCYNNSIVNIAPIPLKVESPNECCKHQKRCSPKSSTVKKRIPLKPKSTKETKKPYNPSPVIVVPIMNLDIPDSTQLKKDRKDRMMERLTIHSMPIVDIQRELMMQKVLHINIVPDISHKDFTTASNNICYIECCSVKQSQQNVNKDDNSLKDIISHNINLIDEARKTSKHIPVKCTLPIKGESVVKHIEGIAESIKCDLKMLNESTNDHIKISSRSAKIDEEKKEDQPRSLDNEGKSESLLIYTYSNEPVKRTMDQNTDLLKTSDEPIPGPSSARTEKWPHSGEVSFTLKSPQVKEYKVEDEFTEIKPMDKSFKANDEDEDEPEICVCEGAYDPYTNRFPSTIYAAHELVCFCDEGLEMSKEKYEGKLANESIIPHIIEEVVESGKKKVTKKNKKGSKTKTGCAKLCKSKNAGSVDDDYVLVHDVSAQASLESFNGSPERKSTEQSVKFEHHFEKYGNEQFDVLKGNMDQQPIDTIKRKSHYYFDKMDPRSRTFSTVKRKSLASRYVGSPYGYGNSSRESSMYPVQVRLDSPGIERIMEPKSIKSSDSAITLDECFTSKNNPIGDTASIISNSKPLGNADYLKKYYKPCPDLSCISEKPARRQKVQRNKTTETSATNTYRKDESVSEGEVKLNGDLSNGECAPTKKNVSKTNSKASSKKHDTADGSRRRQVVHNQNWVSFYYPKNSSSKVPHLGSRSSK